MKRASFESLAEELISKGYPKDKIRFVLKKLIKEGIIEGNDEIGYILTEKGVDKIEPIFFRKHYGVL